MASSSSSSEFARIFESGSAFGHAAALRLLALADAAIAARGRFTLALSGGSMMAQLGPTLVQAAREHSFDHWHIFLADERCVSHDSPDSNFALVKKHFLDGIAASGHALPEANMRKLDLGALAVSVEAAAESYEGEIKALFAHPSGSIPEFDAVFLGMGPDGHTASLFPAHALLAESVRLIAPIRDSPKPPPQRITFTLPLILAARNIVFMVGGAEKAPVIRHIMQQPRLAGGDADALAQLVLRAQRSPPAPDAHDAAVYPAQLVHAAARQIEWFVDRAAASQLAAAAADGRDRDSECSAPSSL